MYRFSSSLSFPNMFQNMNFTCLWIFFLKNEHYVIKQSSMRSPNDVPICILNTEVLIRKKRELNYFLNTTNYYYYYFKFYPSKSLYFFFQIQRPPISLSELVWQCVIKNIKKQINILDLSKRQLFLTNKLENSIFMTQQQLSEWEDFFCLKRQLSGRKN